ncbi:hypothetical protein [Heyndrickxia coagulans]|uniref:hypothetical protein n=1 Tax=Heyndrickxia coagulans TaxID=1398 RepID=UPI00047B549A|nr:hypothetical protein [Heyndrickxia coagulans]MED4407097.1 hypothetical protein [Heyndrickxia coagulans]MED4936023.1 hypothetical protein [Heyndrickxia coagulans]MED4965319.1 hypothetical protein [Heyndrickxia coagulans]MED4967401.1 hypothetical protein [Heyndrickxia coagulans]
MAIKVILIIIGIIIIVIGVFYNKQYHEKHFASDSSFGINGGDGFIVFIIETIVITVLSILPWYIFKFILFLIGISLIVIGFKFV